MVEPERRWFTVREAALALHMSPQTLWRRIRQGRVVPLTVDEQMVIPRAALHDLATNRSIGSRQYERQTGSDA